MTFAFDLFGTVLDWRVGLAAEGRRLGKDLFPQPNWDAIAVAWSKGYAVHAAALNDVESYSNLSNVLAGILLDDLVHEFGLKRMSPEGRAELSTAWSRLPAFADAEDGLGRMAARHDLVTLSNAGYQMQMALKSRNRLPWKTLYSADEAQNFKPHPRVYLKMLANLGELPRDVTMVAAHTFDLNAAHAVGMKTILVERAGEPGSGRKGLDHEAVHVVPDLRALADALHC